MREATLKSDYCGAGILQASARSYPRMLIHMVINFLRFLAPRRIPTNKWKSNLSQLKKKFPFNIRVRHKYVYTKSLSRSVCLGEYVRQA